MWLEYSFFFLKGTSSSLEAAPNSTVKTLLLIKLQVIFICFNKSTNHIFEVNIPQMK